MKTFLMLLSTLFLLSSCQQEHVPEIIYYMDSEVLTSQTRHVREKILYKSPINSQKKVQVFAFSGFVYQIQTKDESSTRISIKNEFGKELIFNVDNQVNNKIHQDMDLIVRYYLNEGIIRLVEIKNDIL
jgi:hypothetical protein